jgi:hypothetical protein
VKPIAGLFDAKTFTNLGHRFSTHFDGSKAIFRRSKLASASCAPATDKRVSATQF